ncbi:hypothetical protein N7520_003875 [Penicillium odoratum]|uniref:uncharacterized protein n=1 Tax=Penicillium odoratum TaxID=1167516 RepID=UPI0025497C7C|nr:uncharacterized protein N7520_003875 [Penicillium odoratum]KAJ5769316.1 hypothetical protein N7520_003875 [Penicillium odoratum]
MDMGSRSMKSRRPLKPPSKLSQKERSASAILKTQMQRHQFGRAYGKLNRKMEGLKAEHGELLADLRNYRKYIVKLEYLAREHGHLDLDYEPFPDLPDDGAIEEAGDNKINVEGNTEEDRTAEEEDEA